MKKKFSNTILVLLGLEDLRRNAEKRKRFGTRMFVYGIILCFAGIFAMLASQGPDLTPALIVTFIFGTLVFGPIFSAVGLVIRALGCSENDH